MFETTRYWLMAGGICLVVAAGACTEAGSGIAPDDAVARRSLETLAGCFSVRYHFVEDGRHDFFLEGSIEYMDVRPRGDGYLVRNFLVSVPDESAFPHWNQEWQPASGERWLMRVTDGAGRLRYESEGVWRFNQWEGAPALAAKPNRDSERTDYDHLERRNSIQLTGTMWVQSENNVKLRADRTAVASELGWIVYARQPDEMACAPAIAAAGSI